jgi:hypothetical protein
MHYEHIHCTTYHQARSCILTSRVSSKTILLPTTNLFKLLHLDYIISWKCPTYLNGCLLIKNEKDSFQVVTGGGGVWKGLLVT